MLLAQLVTCTVAVNRAKPACVTAAWNTTVHQRRHVALSSFDLLSHCCCCCCLLAVHPGFADSTWYLKSDNEAYFFSWLIAKVRSVIPWLGVGQPCTTGAISTIYAAMAPELQGSTSSVGSKGLIDSVCRALFGGRLKYFGPHYVIQNCFNAWPRWATNPWNYNRGACVRMYEGGLELIRQVEQELGLQQQQQPGGGAVNGNGAGPQAVLPAGKADGAVDGSNTRKRKGGSAAVVNGAGAQPVPAA